MAERPRRAVTRRDLGRIVAFTDGVMAVAITLLVLNLEVPEVGRGQSLGDALVDQLPSLGAYLLAFGLVGRFWVIHHNLFESLHDFDSILMTLNLSFLALIVLVPFSANLYDDYTREPVAAAVLGGTLGLAATAHAAMTAYVARRGFSHAEHPPPQAGVWLPAAFLVSVPLAFASVHLAEATWIATIVLRYPLRRLGATST